MRIVAACCLLIAFFVGVLAQWIDDPGTDTIYGARFWPVFLAVVLFTINIPAVLISERKSGPLDPTPTPSSLRFLDTIDWSLFLVPCVVIVSYPLAVEVIGFPLASVLLYIVLMLVLRQAPSIIMLGIGVVFPLVISFFFTRIAYMPLPKGVGPFEDFTILLYRTLGAF